MTTPAKPARALGLCSGGLDSTLAGLVLRKQGILVEWVTFETPFFSAANARRAAKLTGIPLRVDNITDEYVAMLRNPHCGYGQNMNPCLDCHALMFRSTARFVSSRPPNRANGCGRLDPRQCWVGRSRRPTCRSSLASRSFSSPREPDHDHASRWQQAGGPRDLDAHSLPQHVRKTDCAHGSQVEVLSFDSQKIVEECRRLRNERQRDWCLLYQAAFRRNPALCPKAHSRTCESWIDNLEDGHADFGGRGSAISTLTGNDVRGTGERIDGKREGPWTGDYNTGVKAFSGFYRNGLQAEDWEEWYEDGSPKSKGRYFDGKKVGRWQEWRPWYGGVGEKREIGYLAGQFHGPVTNWDREGNLVSQGSWLLGQRHGRLRQWSGNRATPDQWFANGRMVSKQEFLESYATGIERRAIEAEVDDEFAAFDRLREEAKRSEDRYLDIWKNEFKRRNSISDDVFDNEIQVEEFSVVCSTAGATVRVTYRVTEGWASALVDDSFLILLYRHAATGPIHADLSVNRLFSEDDVRRAIDRQLNSIIHSYRSPRSLVFASRSDAEQALMRAVPTGKVQPDLWSIDFLSSSFSLGTYGEIDIGKNLCFSASLDLSTGETQVLETVCAIYN